MTMDSLEARLMLTVAVTDPTFGTGGSIDFKYDGFAVQSNGAIIAAGSVGDVPNTDITFARFNVDGSLDTTFGRNGQVRLDLYHGGDDRAYGFQPAPGRKIVILASSFGPGDQKVATGNSLVRLNVDGTVDKSFGKAGIADPDRLIPGLTSIDITNVDAKGRILIEGTYQTP